MALAMPVSIQVFGQLRPQTTDRRRRARRPGKRFRSKKVRERNAQLGEGRELWQPSRAIKKFSPPRAAVLASALREHLDEDKPAEQPTVVGYEEPAVLYAVQRELEEENIIHETAEESGVEDCDRAARLCNCQAYFEDEITSLEEDPDVGNHACAVLLEGIDRQALQCLAAA